MKRDVQCRRLLLICLLSWLVPVTVGLAVAQEPADAGSSTSFAGAGACQ